MVYNHDLYLQVAPSYLATPGNDLEQQRNSRWMSLEKIDTSLKLAIWTVSMDSSPSHLHSQEESQMETVRLPTWSDKPPRRRSAWYWKPTGQFSDHSHGFRPKRVVVIPFTRCHTKKVEVQSGLSREISALVLTRIDHTVFYKHTARENPRQSLYSACQWIGCRLFGKLEIQCYSGVPQGGVVSPIYPI